MAIKITIDGELEQDLLKLAKESHASLNDVIQEVLVKGQWAVEKKIQKKEIYVESGDGKIRRVG